MRLFRLQRSLASIDRFLSAAIFLGFGLFTAAVGIRQVVAGIPFVDALWFLIVAGILFGVSALKVRGALRSWRPLVVNLGTNGPCGISAILGQGGVAAALTRTKHLRKSKDRLTRITTDDKGRSFQRFNRNGPEKGGGRSCILAIRIGLPV